MLLKIGLGAGFWGIMFLGVCALMVTPLPALWQAILEIVLAGVAGYVLGMIYFKKNPGEVKDGIVIAVIWLVVGAILDLLITVQYTKASGTYIDGLRNLYGNWQIWVSFVVFIVAVVLSAKMTRGGAVMKSPQQPPAAPPTQPSV